MTPPDRRSIVLRTGTVATPIGAMLLVTDPEDRLRAAEFADVSWRLERFLGRRFARDGYRLVADDAPSDAGRALAAYFSGALDALATVEPWLDGTPFQIAVWQALRTTIPGQPLTYRTLAHRLGRPEAARAVGHANGTNPLSIVVPCHRLLGTSGALTGYGGGIKRKRWLLDHEARHVTADRLGRPGEPDAAPLIARTTAVDAPPDR